MAKILFVEDNESIQKTLGMCLSDICKHYVVPAFDGQEGLKILSEIKDVQIIISDYNMIPMDGFRFTEQIRTNPEYKHYSNIPIIGLGDFPKDRREHLTEFRTKPATYLELNELIKKHCI